MSIDWDKYKNFSKHEFDCTHTGKNKMLPEFLDVLQDIRSAYNKPMIITSGYRDKTHPIESAKQKAGEHSYGAAVDVAVERLDAMDLFVIAYGFGIRRIGLSQKGSRRFMHIGYGDKFLNFPQSLWTY